MLICNYLVFFFFVFGPLFRACINIAISMCILHSINNIFLHIEQKLDRRLCDMATANCELIIHKMKDSSLTACNRIAQLAELTAELS